MKIQKVKSVLKYDKGVVPLFNSGMQVSAKMIQFTNLQTTVSIMKAGNTGDLYSIDAKGIFANGEVGLVEEWINEAELGDKLAEFHLSHENTDALMRAAAYLAKDDLRPAMTGVVVNKHHFAYTDAHVLGYHEHGLNLQDNVNHILNPELVNLIDDSAYKLVIFQEYSMLFTRIDGYEATVTSRNIDEKYPNYLAVIPDAESYTNYVEISAKQLKELHSFSKRHLKTMYSQYCAALDFSDDFAYVPANVGGSPKIPVKVSDISKVNTIIMPVMIPDNDDYYNKSRFRVNLDLLARITKGASSVKIHYFAPNRAMALEISYCNKVKRESQLSLALKKIARLENLLTINNIDY